MTIVDMNDTLSTVQIAGGQPKKDLPPSMVERMTLILDAFDGRAARLTLEEVACRTQLPRSTVHRILDQLVKLDWVDHASFGYCLGRRALGLGGGDGGHSQIREAAAPLLHELHLQTGMVVHLSVLDGRESVYLDKVGGRFAAAPCPASAAECSLIRRLVARRCWRGSTPSASTLCSGLLFPAAPRTRSPTSLCSTRN